MYYIKMQSPCVSGPAFLKQIITVRDRPKVYGWTTNPAEAMQMDADKAICVHGEIAAIPHHGEIVTIVPVARSLADQLDTRRLGCLAAMLGYKEAGCIFGEALKQTPPLPHGFTMRDAALAYIDTLRANLVVAAPETRT